ncbi:dynein light chain roadblock-type 1-like protein, partial [Nannochloropsis gaditana CCMP526]|uniref:dynein light chain roadblock-type 1-like protein n=1 Tax=Nannochloropsis gaditana (strain CCMP526) TaxID=1093141 RepID=UPI00029F5D93
MALMETPDHSMSSNEALSSVDSTLKRLQNLKNVQQVLVLTKDGVALHSSVDQKKTAHQASLI